MIIWMYEKTNYNSMPKLSRFQYKEKMDGKSMASKTTSVKAVDDNSFTKQT